MPLALFASFAAAAATLPDGYREIEWLGSSGSQYIDTGFAFSRKCSGADDAGAPRVEGEMMLMTADDRDVAGTAVKQAGCFIVDYEGTTLYYRYASTDYDDATFSSIVGKWTAFSWGPAAKHDGATVVSASHGLDFSSNTQTFRLFGARDGSFSSVRFKWVKMYEGGALVRDFQPAWRASDGVAGLYDHHTGTFFTNAGSGEFSYSGLKPLSTDVTRLDWLESSGTQLIDTGVTFTNEPLVTARMMLRTADDKDVAGTPANQAGCFIVDYEGSTLYYRYGATSYKQAVFTSIVDTWVDCTWGPSAQHGDTTLVTYDSWDFSANTQTFRLFGARSGTFSSVRFGDVAMYDGDDLVRDFVPARLRVLPAVAGMYDRVSGVLYLNAGSGDFILGPDATTADELLVTDDRSEEGTPSPAYGAHYGLAQGAALTCTAPAETLRGETGYRYACTGWTLYTNNAEGVACYWRSGRTTTLNYVHPGHYVKLVWNWSQELDPDQWSASSYAQEGLIAQWDGWENAGRGVSHDSAATSWADLTGNGHTLGNFNSGTGWTTNSFVLPNSAYSMAAKITGAALTSDAVLSFEVVYRETSRCNYATFLFGIVKGTCSGWKGFAWHDDLVHFQNGGQGWSFAQPRSYPQPIHTMYASFASFLSDAADGCWADGVQLTTRTGSDTWTQNVTGIGYANNSSWWMGGEVYAIRVYNRKLTDEEIVHNARIDDYRFRGVAHADELRVESAMGDYGTASPAYGSVTTGHAAGEEITCTAPATCDVLGDGTCTATCIGCNVCTNVPGGDAYYLWQSPTLAVDGTDKKCTFTFPAGASVKVVWLWKVVAAANLDFSQVAAVTENTASLELTVGGYGGADSAKLMAAWGVAADDLMFTNVLLETAIPATTYAGDSALALSGLFPGSTLYARLFLLCSDGTVVEQNQATFSFTTASDAVKSASDYVQNGLVAMWDGVENVGWGMRDLSSKTWHDLVDARDMALVNSGTFTANALYVSGSSAKGSVAAPSYRAIEIAFRQTADQYAVLFMSGIHQNRMVFSYKNSGQFMFEGGKNSPIMPVTYSASAMHTIAANWTSLNYSSGSVSRQFLDGAYKASSGSANDGWGGASSVLHVGTRAYGDTGYPFNGYVHAIRLYNRELTDTEIAANRAVDENRFGSGASTKPVCAIASAQLEYGTVYPDWGSHASLDSGESALFYAPDQVVSVAAPAPFAAIGDVELRARVLGYTWERYDSSYGGWRTMDAAATNAFTFTQGATSSRVTWNFFVQGPAGVTAAVQTETNSATATLAAFVSGYGYTEAASAALKIAWGAAGGGFPFTNLLEAAVLPGVVSTNVLAGIPPASKLQGKLFLVDSLGQVAAESPVFAFETKSVYPIPGFDVTVFPTGAKILDYVTFNGSTYVSTGIVPSGHEVKMTFRITTYVNDGHVMGTDVNNAQAYMHFTEFSSKYYYGSGGSDRSWGATDQIKHELDFNQKSGSSYVSSFDGASMTMYGLSASSGTLNIGRRSNTTNWKGEMYSFEVISHATGESVLRYFPAIDPDGKVCFWDAVNVKFVYPASGTLTAGPEREIGAALYVEAWPGDEYGELSPAVGVHAVDVGATLSASAADWADGTRHAEILGCNVYTNDADGAWTLAEEFAGNSFTCEMPAGAVKFLWRQLVRNETSGLAFNGVVDTNGTEAVLAVDVTGYGLDATNAELCVAWGFKKDELLYTNVLVSSAWAGLSTNVTFAGRAPGSRYYARVFLRLSNGDVVETTDAEPFTFKTTRTGGGGSGVLEIGKNLITNPSFEADQNWSRNSYAYASATKQPTGWSTSTSSGLAWSGCTWNGGNLPDGNYAAYMQNVSWMTTTFTAPRKAVYGLQYWYTRRPNYSNGHVETVTVDGVEITNIACNVANNNFVQTPLMEFVLAAGEHELRFDGYATGDKTTSLDVIDLHAVRSLNDELEVVGYPRDYGEPSPDYGTSDNLESGEKFTVQAYDYADGTLVAKVKGYEVYTNDVTAGTGGLYLSGARADLSAGNGMSFEYVHTNLSATLTWQWSVHDEPGLEFRGVLETNMASAVFDVYAQGWGYSGETAVLKMAYGFAEDALVYTNDVWDYVVPRTQTNLLVTGFIPGQTYYARLFIEADDGTVVDCGVTRELTTPVDWTDPSQAVGGDPGLWQYAVSGDNVVASDPKIDWDSLHDDRILNPQPIHAGNGARSKWTSADGTKNYEWNGHDTLINGTRVGTWAWSGYMWFDNVTYTFGAAFDDHVRLKIDGGSFNWWVNSSGWPTPQKWTPPRGAGWYAIEIMVGDGGGGWGGWGWTWGLAWNVTGYTAKDNSSNWKAFKDPGDGSLFRTEPGVPADKFIVAAAPSNYEANAAAPCPYYGTYSGLAEGEGFYATMPHQFDDGRAFLTTLGWEIYTNVAPTDAFALRESGSGTTAWYRHGDVAGKLTWVFLVSNHLEVAANVARRGNVMWKRKNAGDDWHEYYESFDQLFATNEVVCIKAVPAAGTAGSEGYGFAKWHGEVPDTETPEHLEIEVTMDVPRKIKAEFTAPHPIGANWEGVFTITGYTGSAALENFPVPLRFSPAAIPGFSYGDVAADAEDLRICEGEDGPELDYEIENWDVDGESLVWVSVPEMNEDVTLTVKYGDGTAPAANDPQAVWTRAGYRAVYHMNEESSSQHDATGNDAMTATTSASSLLLGNGVYGPSLYKNATLSAPNFHANTDISQNRRYYTVSGWYYWPGVSGSPWLYPLMYGTGGQWSWYLEYPGSITTIRAVGCWWECGRVNTLDVSKFWNHVAIGYDGSKMVVYVNGKYAFQNSNWIGDTTSRSLDISGTAGWVDETRVRNKAPSADWILAEWEFGTNGSAAATCPGVGIAGGGPETFYATVNPKGLGIDGDAFSPRMGKPFTPTPVRDSTYQLQAPETWSDPDRDLMAIRRGYLVYREDGWCETNLLGGALLTRSFTEMEEIQWQYDVYHGLVETNADSVAFGFTLSGFVPTIATSPTGTIFALWGYTSDELVNSNTLCTVGAGGYAAPLLVGLEPKHAYAARVYFRYPNGTLVEDPHGLYRFRTTEEKMGGSPGLYQCRISTSGNSVGKTIDWSQYTSDRVLKPYPVHGTYDWTSADGTKSYSWRGGGTWGWSGYMWFDNATYTFGGAYDDYFFLRVNGTTILNANGSSLRTGSFKPPYGPGWYPIEIHVSDTGGGYGPWNWNWGIAWNVTGYTKQDSSSNWHAFVDPGDGSFLRTDGGLSGIEVEAENVADGKLASVDLSFYTATIADGTLYALYGPVGGVDETNTWARAEKVCTVAKGTTELSGVAVPAAWGSPDARVMRYHFVSASETYGSTKLYFRDYAAPYLTEFALDGLGGDTLNVQGRLKQCSALPCTLRVWVGDVPELQERCWKDFAGSRRTKARAFNFDLFEENPESELYFRPGRSYWVCVEAEDALGRKTRSEALEVKMLESAAFGSSSLSSLDRRTAKFTVKMGELGATGLDTVSLWVGESSATNELGEADDSLFNKVGSQSIVDTSDHVYQYTFPELDEDYYWQFRSVNWTQGGTTNWEIRTEPSTVSTKDTTTYTWKRDVREGSWTDKNCWNANNADALGWPSSKSCSVNFESGTEATIHCPTNVCVDYIYFNSKHMKLTFDTQGRVPGDAPVDFYATRMRFFDNKSDNTDYADEISFSDLKVWWSYDWDYHPVGWRLTFTDGAVFNYPHDAFRAYPTTKNAAYGWNQLEVLNGATANFNNYYFGGGARVLVSNATMVCRSQFLVSCWQGGGVVRLEGTNPVLKVGGNFRGDIDRSGNISLTNQWGGCEFNVPVGGYVEPPIQCTGSGNNPFGGTASDASIAKPLQLWICKESPAAWVDETIDTPLVAWSKTVNTNQVALEEIPNPSTDVLLWSSPAHAAWCPTNEWDASYSSPTGIAVRIVGSSRMGVVTVTGTPYAVDPENEGYSPRADDGTGCGDVTTLTHDTEFFTAPESYVTEDVIAICSGVKVYEIDPLTKVRTEVEPISHPAANQVEIALTNGWNEIEWQWDVKYRVQVSASGSGDVSATELWVTHGEAPENLVAESTSSAASFYQWSAMKGTLSADRPTLMTTNFTCAITEPMVLTAEFGSCWYVATNGNDSAAGTSPDAPLKTVKKGYEKAADGDTVVVGSGAYDFYASNNDNDILTMTKAVTVQSQTGNPADVLLWNNRRNRRVVWLKNAAARIKDVTVRYGGTCGNDQIGTCVRIDTAGGIVDNCIIRDGTSWNWNTYASAIACYSGSGYVVNSTIRNNTCGYYGSTVYGLAVYMNKGLMRNCLIEGNYTASKEYNVQGIVYLEGSARLENCVFTKNQARNYAGVYLVGNSTATVDGCTFWENEAAGDLETCTRDCFDGPPSRFTNCKARKAFDENWTAIGGIPDESSDFTVMPTPSKLMVNNTVTFTPHYVHPEGKTIEKYDYVWGDGTEPETITPNLGATTLQSRSHKYEKPGQFSPKIQISYKDESDLRVSDTVEITVFPTNMYCRPPDRAANWPNDSYKPEFPYDDPGYNCHTNLAELVDMAIDGCTIQLWRGSTTVGPVQTPIKSTLHVQKGVTIRGCDPANPGMTHLYRPSGDYRMIRLDHPRARLEHLCVSNAYWNNWDHGVAVYMQGYGGVMSNCLCKANSTGSGYNLFYVNGAQSIVTHCVFTNNVKSTDNTSCGMVAWIGGGARIDNTLFIDNQLTAGSGGSTIATVWVDNGWLANCTVVNNMTRMLGGVYANGTYGKVVNCAILGNTAVARTEEYNDIDPGQSSAYHNCVTSVDMTPYYNYTCEQNDPWNAFNDWEARDLTPYPAGPLHETGTDKVNDMAVPYGKTDLAYKPRVMASIGGKVDVGCYECQATNSFQVGFEVSDNMVAENGILYLTPKIVGGRTTDKYEFEWDPTCYGFNNEMKNILWTNEVVAVPWSYTGVGYKSIQLRVTRNPGKTYAETYEVKRKDVVYVSPESIYVDPESKFPTEPYNTWPTAATNFSQALSLARSGSKITLAAGLYEIKSPFSLKYAITLQGATSNASDVVIRKMSDSPTNDKYYVMELSNTKAFVSGVTIDGGATKGRWNCGVYVDYGGGTVSNCVIQNCWEHWAWKDSGAAWRSISGYGTLSHTIVTNCRVQGNYGTRGVVWSGAGRVSNCLVIDNSIGSGVNYPIVRTSCPWDNCTIVRNKLEKNMNNRYHLYVESALGGFRNCVIADNFNNGQHDLTRNLGSGTNRYNAADCDATIGSVGLMSIDEDRYGDCFLNVSGKIDAKNENFRACARSPIKNHGSEEGVLLPATDLDKRQRFKGNKPDIGCYESVTPDGLLLIIK